MPQYRSVSKAQSVKNDASYSNQSLAAVLKTSELGLDWMVGVTKCKLVSGYNE